MTPALNDYSSFATAPMQIAMAYVNAFTRAFPEAMARSNSDWSQMTDRVAETTRDISDKSASAAEHIADDASDIADSAAKSTSSAADKVASDIAKSAPGQPGKL